MLPSSILIEDSPRSVDLSVNAVTNIPAQPNTLVEETHDNLVPDKPTLVATAPVQGTLPSNPENSSSNPHYAEVPWRRPKANLISSEPSFASDPKNITEACNSLDWEGWKAALETKQSNCKRHQVWKIVPKPAHCQELDTTWVLKSKYGADGEFIKKKARLCARGFWQVKGIDYNKTFAPTGRLSSLWIILSLVASHGLELHQMDVKCAFLNGVPQEDIFIKVPEGLDIKIPQGYGLKLFKSLYGLKQSPCCWYPALSSFFLSLDFKSTAINPCVFIHSDPTDFCIVYVHVDNLVIGSTSSGVSKFKEKINLQFEMEDLGKCKWILGMRVNQDRTARNIHLHQDCYINNMLSEFGMTDCKVASTPLPQGASKIPISPSPPSEGFNYQQAVGLLNYLVQCTQPDLAFCWSYLSQFLNSPLLTHQQQFNHVLCYLKLTRDRGISLGGPSDMAFSLSAYCDADHASSINWQSFTGSVLLLQRPVMWRCSKQAMCALSTTEAKHQSCSESGQDLLLATQFLSLLAPLFHQKTFLQVMSPALPKRPS